MISPDRSLGIILAERYHLQRDAGGFRGVCPFSCSPGDPFRMNTSGEWRCECCRRAGTPWSLIERIEGLALPDAVRTLTGATLPGTNDTSRNRATRLRLLAANAFAADFYAQTLRHHPEAAAARAYLTHRGISATTCETFGLGFDLKNAREQTRFRAAFAAAGFDRDTGIAAGLLAQSKHGGVYPFFRERITIPVRAQTGDILGFGGRAVGSSARPYLNTRATAIYRKGAILFGLDLAAEAIVALSEAIVVEGYFDCMTLQAAGFTNTVATLGTAFTNEHAQILTRLGATLMACFDGDAAGKRAADVTEQIAAAHDLPFRRVNLPNGADPDDFVRNAGPAAFGALLATARRAPWNVTRTLPPRGTNSIHLEQRPKGFRLSA